MGKYMIMSFVIESLMLMIGSALIALIVQQSAEWILAFSEKSGKRWIGRVRTNEHLIKPLCRLKHPLNPERRAQAEFDWGWNYLG